MQDKFKYHFFEVQQQFCDFTLFNNRQYSDQYQGLNNSNNKFWFRKKKKEVDEEEKKDEESDFKIKSDEKNQNRLKSPSHMEVRDSNEKFWFRLKSKYRKPDIDENCMRKEIIDGEILAKNLGLKETKGRTKGLDDSRDGDRLGVRNGAENKFTTEGGDQGKGWRRIKDRKNGNGRNDDFGNRVLPKERHFDKNEEVDMIKEKPSHPSSPRNQSNPKPPFPLNPDLPNPSNPASTPSSSGPKLPSHPNNQKILQKTSFPSTPSSKAIQSPPHKKTLNINQVALIDIPSKSKNASYSSNSSGLEIHPQSGFHILTPKSNGVYSLASASRPSIAIQTAPNSTKHEKRPKNESRLRRDSKQGTIISVISLHCKRLEDMMENKFSKLNKNLDYIDERIKQARKVLNIKKNESFSSDNSKSKSFELIRKFHRTSLNPIVMAHSSRTVDKLTAAWADVLAVIKCGKICEGFSKCLDMEDDLYFLRLLHLFGPCFKFIPHKVCVRVMGKLIDIVESRFVEQMAREWIGQGKI